MLKGLKKLVSAFCVASMVLSLAVVPAMAETITNVTAFTGISRITVTNGTDAEHTITLTNAGNANNGLAYAYADISSVISGQASYKIEYDSYLKSGSRARIELADLTKRPSSSNKNGYENSGVVFCQGVVDSSSYVVNGNKSSYAVAPAARDNWVHTSLEVDVTNKKFSVSITGTSVNTTYNNVDFMNNDAVPTGITYLDYINSQEAKIKNIKITTKVSPTVTVTKDSTKLNLDPGATSDIAELTNAKTVEVTDTNGNDVLTNGLNGFTFVVDSNKSKVSVTAPSTVGANNTAAVKIKATSEDSLTAEGTVTIKVLSDQDVVDDAYNALTLDSVQGLTKKAENTYDVTDEFELPQSSTQARIDWSFPEGTTCAAVENGKVVIKDFSNGTAVTLTATIGYYVTAKTKTFTLNFPTADTLYDDLSDARFIEGEPVKVVKDGEEYTVDGNFNVVQSNDSGTKFVWGSSQYGEITIDSKGNATVDTSEETTVTLKVSARKYSVQDDTYSKTVTIHIEYAPKNIFRWIYTDGMKYNWSTNIRVNPTYTDYQTNGMLISNTYSSLQTITATPDSEITKHALITYKLAAAERGENASVTVNTGGIVSVLFPKQHGTTVKVGDTEYGFGALSDITYMTKKCVTPFLIIKHYINFDSQTVYTTIQREDANEDEYVCKNVITDFEDSSVTSLKELSIVLGNHNGVYLKSIRVDELSMPDIAFEKRIMNTGDSTTVATVTGANTTPAVTITGDDADKFSYSVEEADGTYSVNIVANDTLATSSYSAYVKVATMSDYGYVNKAATVTAVPCVNEEPYTSYDKKEAQVGWIRASGVNANHDMYTVTMCTASGNREVYGLANSVLYRAYSAESAVTLSGVQKMIIIDDIVNKNMITTSSGNKIALCKFVCDENDRIVELYMAADSQTADEYTELVADTRDLQYISSSYGMFINDRYLSSGILGFRVPVEEELADYDECFGNFTVDNRDYLSISGVDRHFILADFKDNLYPQVLVEYTVNKYKYTLDSYNTAGDNPCIVVKNIEKTGNSEYTIKGAWHNKEVIIKTNLSTILAKLDNYAAFYNRNYNAVQLWSGSDNKDLENYIQPGDIIGVQTEDNIAAVIIKMADVAELSKLVELGQGDQFIGYSRASDTRDAIGCEYIDSVTDYVDGKIIKGHYKDTLINSYTFTNFISVTTKSDGTFTVDSIGYKYAIDEIVPYDSSTHTGDMIFFRDFTNESIRERVIIRFNMEPMESSSDIEPNPGQYPYTITSLKIKNADGTDGINLSAKSVMIEMGALEKSERNFDDYFIVALYSEDGALIGLNYMRTNPDVNKQVTFGINVPKSDVVKRVKGFIFNSLEDMQPLSNSVELNIQ